METVSSQEAGQEMNPVLLILMAYAGLTVGLQVFNGIKACDQNNQIYHIIFEIDLEKR